MNLSDLQTGDKGVIIKVKGRGSFRKRITEMGFIKGKQIIVIKNAPLKDPIEYKIMDYSVSLRRSEAALIEVLDFIPDSNTENGNGFEGTKPAETIKNQVIEKTKTINLALIGNPNCGKTTLYNFASGSKERVGNYSGITVDIKTAVFKFKDYTFNITDLPGTYSLTAYSPEELYVRNFILSNLPDVIVNVVDASNLERNLYLTTQLIDMDVNMVIALNIYDELQKKGARLDYHTLSEMIGIPIIPTVSSKGKGIAELFQKIIDVYENKVPQSRHIHINYGKTIENSILKIQSKLKIEQNLWLTDQVSSRFLALKLIENDKEVIHFIEECENFQDINETAKLEREKLKNFYNEDSETTVTDARYGFISGALKETYRESHIKRRRKTDIIDTFLTHKVFGYPIFIFFIWLTFQSTFTLGQYPMEWIDVSVAALGNFLQEQMAPGMLKDLLIEGIIGGVGSVIIFLPNILILFFFISLMEDTGYMARVAFLMDKIMHKIGLHGKSFIPLIMGFGCNVPAIMATRTLENRSDRLLTILINPFMSCSARLPVYLIIIGAIFPAYAGTMLFSLYISGIVIAALMAIVFKKTMFKSKEAPFVMELPPYRMPTLKSTSLHMWHKGQQYLSKMGGIILVASIIIWSLGYFPRDNYQIRFLNEQADSILQLNSKITGNSITIQQNQAKVDSLLLQAKLSQSGNSYIGRIGKFVEPVMRPLGFDWKMSVSILTGITAKEVIVSTLGVLYQTESNSGEGTDNLKNSLKKDHHLTPLAALSFLVFILIYFPCIAVVAAIKKETGKWKWAFFVVVYTTLLAWLVSFMVYQVGILFT
ncbi:MAG: ferrous iron transport protein B [Bacteroidales bacterium]